MPAIVQDDRDTEGIKNTDKNPCHYGLFVLVVKRMMTKQKLYCLKIKWKILI